MYVGNIKFEIVFMSSNSILFGVKEKFFNFINLQPFIG